MQLTQYQLKIINAEICPYCGSNSKLVTEEFIYGISYKNRSIFCCENYPNCDSYVGTHDDGKPLGRLANHSLRRAKIKAHEHFDKIWKENLIERGELYGMLSDHLGIPKEYTHMGMFQEHTLLQVEKYSQQLYKDLKNGTNQ